MKYLIAVLASKFFWWIRTLYSAWHIDLKIKTLLRLGGAVVDAATQAFEGFRIIIADFEQTKNRPLGFTASTLIL